MSSLPTLDTVVPQIRSTVKVCLTIEPRGSTVKICLTRDSTTSIVYSILGTEPRGGRAYAVTRHW